MTATQTAETPASKYVPPKYEAYVAGKPQFFMTESEATDYVDQFESGEVRRIWDDVQVYVKFPRPTWV